jgi:uncharacterized protein
MGPAPAGFPLMSGFKLDLGTLRPGSNRVEVESEPRELDLPESGWAGPVSGSLQVERAGERVTVRGTVRGVARLECVRCLGAFTVPLEAPLDVFAERIGTARRKADEVELDRDDYMRFHDGRMLDLREDAREALLLEIPMTPRCREDCRGLCPTCGADLNQGPCGCDTRA